MVKMQRADIAATAATVGVGLHFETEPCLFPTLYKWLEHVPDAYSDPKQQARLARHCVKFTCSLESTGVLVF